MDTESKHYEVVISDQAAQMLLSHVRFLAQVSEVAVIRLINAFQKMLRRCSSYRSGIHGWLIHSFERINIGSYCWKSDIY